LNFDTSDCHIEGGCDLFTTKPVGSDRKLYKTIDKHFDALIESNNNNNNGNNGNNDNNNHHIISPNESFLNQKRRFSSTDVELNNNSNNNNNTIDSSSPKSLEITPFGPLNQTTSRRTFAYLISILNVNYPDYDFTNLNPTDFNKINWNFLKSKFNNILISLGKSSSNLNWIFNIINSHINLKDCAFYELNFNDYLSSNLNYNFLIDDEPGNLWSYKWFIFNKKMKRVAFLYLNGFRLSSPKLNSNISLSKRRRLTIDNENDDNEEYDLTYSDDDVIYDDDYDDINNLNNEIN